MHQAENARQALDVVASGCKIDILLSDVVLPGGVDGIRLADTVKRQNEDVKVLLMSGYAGEVLAEGEKITSYRLLQKPFSLDELLGALRNVLDEKPA